ncbi:hypothetical protein ACFL59_06915 [Planctomycetota bacterium]
MLRKNQAELLLSRGYGPQKGRLGRTLWLHGHFLAPACARKRSYRLLRSTVLAIAA